MKKRKTARILALASAVGLVIFAVQFAASVSRLFWPGIFLCFFLSTVCVETLFFTLRWLFREKRKKP